MLSSGASTIPAVARPFFVVPRKSAQPRHCATIPKATSTTPTATNTIHSTARTLRRRPGRRSDRGLRAGDGQFVAREVDAHEVAVADVSREHRPRKAVVDLVLHEPAQGSRPVDRV